MPDLDLDLVRHALATARSNGLSEVELEVGDGRFSARLGAVPAVVPISVADPGDSLGEGEPDVRTINAPLVGYYRPGAEPLAVGTRVTKGAVVAVVAALGLANDVESPFEGEVVEVLVDPEDPVQFGQPLAKVRVAP